MEFNEDIKQTIDNHLETLQPFMVAGGRVSSPRVNTPPIMRRTR